MGDFVAMRTPCAFNSITDRSHPFISTYRAFPPILFIRISGYFCSTYFVFWNVKFFKKNSTNTCQTSFFVRSNMSGFSSVYYPTFRATIIFGITYAMWLFFKWGSTFRTYEPILFVWSIWNRQIKATIFIGVPFFQNLRFVFSTIINKIHSTLFTNLRCIF